MSYHSIKKEWAYREYINRENNIPHAPYEAEINFYNAVKRGDTKKVAEYCREDFAAKEGWGILSSDELKNLTYHFIISTAIISRYCIDAGLSHEEAYSLSDFYIQKADNCKDLKSISALHNTMAMDYAEKMHKLKNKGIYSKHIVKCINYIYDNLHTRITIENLAAHTGLNPSYLSKLFKKETGMAVSTYITTQKIETAKNMLKYSEYTPSEIASALAFPSQSYFTEVFKKYTNTTPGTYRRTP